MNILIVNLLKCKILGKRKPQEFMRCNTLEKGDNHLRCENHHYKSDNISDVATACC